MDYDSSSGALVDDLSECGPELDAALATRTVREVMVNVPKTLSADLTVGDALAAFEDSHVHMLLLVRNGILLGTLTRDDLPPQLSATSVALPLTQLRDRTVAPDANVAEVHRLLLSSGNRRLAVVDAENRLLGLLCMKRSKRGFCSDEGVNARRLERLQSPPAS